MNLVSYLILALVLMAFAFALGCLLNRRGKSACEGCASCDSASSGENACRDCPLRQNCDKNRTDGNPD